MANIYSYIRNYKDKNFYEEKFNEIDNLVFSSLIYLNFSNIVSSKRKYITLKEAGEIYLKENTYFDVRKFGIPQSVGYNVLKLIVNTKRYKNVLLYNYFYDADINKQIGALTFRYKKEFIYVAFEGTDQLLSGWKEDFQIAYEFPVPAQEYSIKYLNNTIKFFDRNIIVGGHSKGGNLALVSSMYCKNHIKNKIKLIYSNDGPGLRKAQIDSINYQKIKDRYIHIIPNYSYVGILLRNDKHKIIKSSRKDILAHSLSTWQIEDNKLKESNLSVISRKLEKSIIMWLDEHDDTQREKMIMTVFNALEKSGIYDIHEFANIKKAIKVIKNLKNIDDETKELVTSFIDFNLSYITSKSNNNKKL